MSINETVLEMHYHHALIDLFRKTFGLGKGCFNFYKYSTQRECFVGFDQAFIQTDLSEEELFNELKLSASKNNYTLSNFFVGLFLQYKVVKEMKKRSKSTPKQVTSKSHYRVSLDTKKNINTGFSQHELLYQLNKNNGAFVYYACPMIFDRAELYNPKVDLEKLKLAKVSSCTSIYSDNETHFIYYNDINSIPIWCSEPVEGISISPSLMVTEIKEKILTDNFQQSQVALLEFLTNIDISLLEESLIIIRYNKEV
jgi:hypothetical protein